MGNYKITIPHAGDYYITFSYFFRNIGYEVIVPPKTTQNTLSIGTRLAPEQACLPFKITLGNLVEGVDAGANIIMMIGGRTGICRLAYYSEVHKKILQNHGYEFEVLLFRLKKELWDILKGHFPQLTVKKFLYTIYVFWNKIITLEHIHQLYLDTRPYEKRRGSSFALKQKLYHALDHADTVRAISRVKGFANQKYAKIPKEKNDEVIRIGLVGEFYLLVDDFSTNYIEDILGELGAEVKLTLTFSDFFVGSIKQIRFLDRFLPTHSHKINKLAKPYVNRAIGGHARQSIGETIYLSKQKCDAIIHIYPFSCMPEIVAGSLLSQISHDINTPVLSLSFDEHTGKAGLRTRIEAFLDMVKRRKANDKNN